MKTASRYCLIIVLALFFSARTACVKEAVGYIPIAQILFFQNLIALIVIAPFVRSAPHKTDIAPIHLLRAGLEGTMLVLTYSLLRVFHTVEVTMMANWSPLFLPLFYIIGLKRPLSLAAQVVGWVGIIAVVLSQFPYSTIGIPIGILGGTLLITASHVSRRHFTEVFFWAHALPTLFFFFFLFTAWTNPHPIGWVLLAIIGLTSIGMELIGYAINCLGPTYPLQPLFYIAVAFSLVIDYFHWRYIPSFAFLIGAVLAVIGCTLTLRKIRKCQS